MFRRAAIILAASCLFSSLYSFAQSTTTTTQTTTNAQGQPQSSTTTTINTPSSSKKHKKQKKVVNPIADVDSKQPDKVLFDRAMDAMKHGKYDVARLSLQTLINTYPDSEYVARAKLAIGDAWYAEGGTAAFAQAESEYKDFITFFPNMPEAAEAQMKIANIHFREMEKADRDPTHARRAEEEYRQMILQFPDSPLVPQAKERLLEVQEVLARREYMIGHFYYLRESYPAAIARLKSVTDTYPLYSGADDALFELGTCYEREADLIRRVHISSNFTEVKKGALIKQYEDQAIAAYDRILTRYPLEAQAANARKRLELMKQPVPKATPEAIAQDKREIESRGSLGTVGKVMENFHSRPDVSEASKVGEPTLVDPKQSSAPDIIRAANESVGFGGGNNQVSVEKIGDGTAPPENAPVPRSDVAPDTTAAAPAASDASSTTPPSGAAAGSDMKNDLTPAPAPGAAPPLPPTQVNDIGTSSSSGTPAATSSSAQQPAAPANSQTESSSKKKKKHKLLPF